MEETKLNRQQRRIKERIEEDAKQMHINLCNKFFLFFMDNDPDSIEVVNKKNELSAKWRLFCSSRQLNKEAFELVGKYCDSIIQEFKAKKIEAE